VLMSNMLEAANGVAKVKHLILAKYDDHNYGYLRIYVDKTYLKIGFHQVGAQSLAQSRFDMVTVGWKTTTWLQTDNRRRQAPRAWNYSTLAFFGSTTSNPGENSSSRPNSSPSLSGLPAIETSPVATLPRKVRCFSESRRARRGSA